MFRLDGKVAVVTGASSGLGVAFAQGLAEAGADVALGARRVDRLAETAALVEATGRRALAVATDVADPESCTHLVALAMEELRPRRRPGQQRRHRHRRPGHPRDARASSASVIDVNLNGCYWMAQACGRVMQPGSTIINISSVLGITTAGLPQAAYAASKAGLIGLTRDLAQQWTGRKGIRVNARRAGVLHLGDDRAVPRGLPRVADAADPERPQGRPRRARRDAWSSWPPTPAATSPARRSPSTAG